MRSSTSLALLALIAVPGLLPAQGALNQFSYDNLRLSGIQLDLGVLGASQLTGTVVGGLRIDYGRIAPNVRLLLGVSYFRSHFDRDARDRFEQRLRGIVIDPSGDDTIRVGQIFLSDIVGDVDFQWVFPQGKTATAYLGLGASVQVRNGSGRAIDGTFVEDALDAITAGLNATMGGEFNLSPAWRFTLEGRGMLSSGLKTVSLRTGLMYRLGGAR